MAFDIQLAPANAPESIPNGTPAAEISHRRSEGLGAAISCAFWNAHRPPPFTRRPYNNDEREEKVAIASPTKYRQAEKSLPTQDDRAQTIEFKVDNKKKNPSEATPPYTLAHTPTPLPPATPTSTH